MAWLIGSKVGRWIATVLLTLAGIGLMLLKAFMAGRAKERAKQREKALKAVRTRLKTDDEIAGLSADDRRKRLREWAQE